MSTAANPNTLLNAILTQQPAVFDRSHWGRIRLTGADRVRFLHNQTTNNIEQLNPQQGCHTVFVTSTGRTIDLASVYALPDSLLLTVSPDMGKSLYDWMDRYIFFSDKVTLTDESQQLFLFTVLGENADTIAKAMGANNLIGQPLFSHQTVQLPTTAESTSNSASDSLIDSPIHMAVGTDLAMPGYTLWGPKEHAEAVWKMLCSAGANPHTTDQWEQLRIQQGHPMPASELTDDDNPLEAGLWHSISFEKGCYIGQETIARLNTYQGVKKRLWGLVLENEVPTGAQISLEGTKVGKVTSLARSEAGIFGLAYIRTKAGGEGLTVEVEGTSAQIIALPFVSHQYYTADK